MSHLANEVKAIAERHHMIPMDISRVTGLPPSHLSRFFNNKQAYVSDETMEKLKAAVCRTNEERAMLVRARMLDACTGVGSEFVEVNINLGGRPRPAENAIILPVRLDPKIHDLISWFASKAIEQPTISAGLVALAKMLGYSPANSE